MMPDNPWSQEVGFLPLIPLAIGGTAALGGLAAGWWAGHKESTGDGPVTAGAKALGKSLGYGIVGAGLIYITFKYGMAAIEKHLK